MILELDPILSVWYTPTVPSPAGNGSRPMELLLAAVAILLVLNLAAALFRKGKKGGFQ